MAQHNDLGTEGERIACEFLEEKGYTILERNWRSNKAEADLIARHKNQLIIVEVKTRTTAYFGNPEEAVDKHKQRMLVKAAEDYLEKNKLDYEVRYDIVSIILNEHQKKINHIEEAFYPYSNEIDE